MSSLSAIFSTAIITAVIIIALSENSCSITNSTVKDEIDQIQTDANLTVRDFAEVRYQKTFVDKSLLIEIILDEKATRLITAPRRFGKSINLSMLRRFFERPINHDSRVANRALFQNLTISHNLEIMKRHFGKHPVLYLDFKLSRAIRSFDDVREFLDKIFHEALRSHSYLLNSKQLLPDQRKYIEILSDEIEYKKLRHKAIAIDVLCKFIFKHFKQSVIVLIDEYDSVCSEMRTSIKDVRETEKIMELFRNMMVDLLYHGKQHTNFVVITATSSILTEKLGTDDACKHEMHKFQENHEYSQFFGLTEIEVKDLLSRFGRESDFDQVKKHYNGYTNNTFDTWSVTNYLKSGGKIRNYWKTSGNAIDLKNVLEITELKNTFSRLISDINDEVDLNMRGNVQENRENLIKLLDKPSRDFWNFKSLYSFLSDRGYFSITPRMRWSTDDNVIVRLANHQIKSHMRECLIQYYQNVYKLNVELAKECASIFDEFSESVADNKSRLEKIRNLLHKIFIPLSFNVQNEDTMRQVIFAVITFSSSFKLCFETNTRLSDAKILMVRNDLKIHINSTFTDTAKAALRSLLLNVDNRDHLSNNSTIKNRIFIGLSMSTMQQISLCALINDTDFKNKICFD